MERRIDGNIMNIFLIEGTDHTIESIRPMGLSLEAVDAINSGFDKMSDVPFEIMEADVVTNVYPKYSSEAMFEGGIRQEFRIA